MQTNSAMRRNLQLIHRQGARVRSLWIEVPKSSSLGLALQWMPLATTEDIWHILDVAPNSPADLAGLLPYGDYIIGSPEGLLKGEAGLGELVEDYIQQSLRLYVYNQEYNVTRLVTIEPSKTWGGQGALGCTLGYGALHRIPAPLEEPPQGPGETLFETTRLSSDAPGRPSSTLSSQGPPRSDAGTPQYLVPADMNLGAGGPMTDNTGPPKAPPVSGRGARKKHGGRTAAAVDMDAYFQEGEEKSREQDYASSPKPNAAVAPPPKGPPPKSGETITESTTEHGEDILTAQEPEEAGG